MAWNLPGNLHSHLLERWISDKYGFPNGEVVDRVKRLGLIRARGTRAELEAYLIASLHATLDMLAECQIKDIGSTHTPEKLK